MQHKLDRTILDRLLDPPYSVLPLQERQIVLDLPDEIRRNNQHRQRPSSPHLRRFKPPSSGRKEQTQHYARREQQDRVLIEQTNSDDDPEPYPVSRLFPRNG